MWEVEPREIISLQGQGGEPFTRLMDALISAQTSELGIPDTALDLNPRANYPDGGVDAAVNQGHDGESSQYFQEPTVWQYKSTNHSNVNVGSLLDGDYVHDLVEEGYRFRVAVADGIPPDTKADWERRLTQMASGICHCRSRTKIVSVSEITNWLLRYPALILRFFRSDLSTIVMPMEAWKESVLTHTPTYVTIDEREGIETVLRDFASFGEQRDDAVISVQGKAGVGKTRLVYEVLSSINAASKYVVYCNDEERAKQAATAAVNHDPARVLIVADECSVESRFQLEQSLRGHADRVRAIAIDNASQRPDPEEPELWLAEIDLEEIREILTSNYPHIAVERIRAYAELAEGFPRLAVDLCENDDEIQDAEAGGYVPPNIRTYLEVRLSEDEWQVVGAIALVGKVGFSGEVRRELAALCEYLNLNEEEVETIARRLHRGTGFIGKAGRYYYITPQVIAQLVFERAWDRWAAPDPDTFLAEFPGQLANRLVGQIADLAREEVREECGNFLSEWIEELSVADLTDDYVVEWIEALCETNPRDYLPQIAELLEDAERPQVEEIATGRGPGWGPRRKLVWLAQRWAAFEDHFWPSERILLQLALAENEPDIANNATAQWKQLFRVVLSGTSLPFERRFALLAERWDEGSDKRELAIGALDGILQPHATRTLSRAVVGGRIPPEEWKPSSPQEMRSCLRTVLRFIDERVSVVDEEWERRLVSLVIKYLRSLLGWELLGQVKAICEMSRLSDEQYGSMLKELEAFAEYDANDRSDEYVEKVEQWRESIQPQGLHHRLVEHLRTGELYGRGSGKAGESKREAIREELAEDLVSSRESFESEVTSLMELESYRVFELGVAVGRRDRGLKYERMILNRMLDAGATPFAKGYWLGVIEEDSERVNHLREWLDEYEAQRPGLVSELAEIAPAELGLASRVVRLYRAGDIPVTALHVRRLGKDAPKDVVSEIIGIVSEESRSGNRQATLCGLDCLEYLLFVSNREDLLEHEDFRACVWRLMEDGVATGELNNRAWGEIVKRLSEYSLERTVALAVEALTSESFGLRRRAEELLGAMAREHSQVVMRHLGDAMLGSESRWRFGIDLFRSLVHNLDNAVILDWLDEVGVEGARRIARHLPPPRTEDGKPYVPRLTEKVLQRFGSDENVFTAFSAGVGTDQTAWTGSLADKHLADAELASKFLDHDNSVIRKWARLEEQSSRKAAKKARIQEEEEMLE